MADTMKIRLIALIIGVFLAGWFMHKVFSPGHESAAKQAEQAKVIWTCPMHPQIISDKPGDCPICFMSLVKKETGSSPSEAKSNTQSDTGVHVDTRRQQLIGVKKETVQQRDLTNRIDTVGKVAYLPNLYVAQQEYLQAIRYRQISQTGVDAGRQDIIEVAKSKLLTLGMNETQIRQIEEAGKPETSLYLPENEQVWISITIYEQDAEFVKEGLSVEVEAIAYPGKVLKGKIVSIAPILEAMTRTLQVRALVDNPANLLKMEMSVNVRIGIPLGKKTAVSQEAVMHTGTKDLVYVVRDDEYFVGREVQLGVKAQGYYEVRKGLQAGDVVVTSGNFLIDSESKLNAALNRIADSNEKP